MDRLQLVERGFSVNTELVVENQSVQTLSARRIIKDHIIHVNDVTNVEITRNMVGLEVPELSMPITWPNKRKNRR